MSVTVTIHKGELKQIKRLIDESERSESKKPARGELYGLWTHSFQPVIQYVTGKPKQKDCEELKECLRKNHALNHIGNWSTVDGGGDDINHESPSFVKMTVELTDKKTMNVKLCVSQKRSSHKEKLDGVIETLDGDSAFRVNAGPFPKGNHALNDRYHHEVVSGPLEVIGHSPKAGNEAETKKEQWYATENGMQLFGKIHGALQQHFEITGTNRDTHTHDISITLKYRQREFIVDFPSNFPSEVAVLNIGRQKQNIILSPTKSQGTGKSGERGQQRDKNSKFPNQQKKKNVAPKEKDEEDEGASMQNDGDEAQQDQDLEKVPELLVQGICRLTHIDFGTRV